jgi:uncharacterized protein (TIGR03437 family)
MKNPYGALVVALCAMLSGKAGVAQTPPAVILQVDVENVVQYFGDTSDPSKFATDPNITTPAVPRNFNSALVLGDIVAVNGQPAKGTMTRAGGSVFLNTAPAPGQAIADYVRNGISGFILEILKSDFTPIGAIVAYGFSGGPPSPGVPLSNMQANFPIVGGSGAFLGARGQMGKMLPQSIATRMASVTEDPGNRRRNGGGTERWVLYVIPLSRPEIVTIFHADFSAVTAAKPAKAGEVLIVRATGLGPAVPGVDPGQPFPSDTVQTVNSPLAVSVNGKPADVINGIGWPGQVDTYRVDFRVPDGIAPGMAAIQLTAAWIAGSAVGIPVQ